MLTTNYTQVATVYDSAPERHRIPIDDALRIHAQTLAPNPCLALDLACGSGLYLRRQVEGLGAANVRWVGCDLSAAMLALARAKTPVPLAQGSVEALPYPAATFDYVALNFAFHHVQDKERALDEVMRVLKPSGLLRVHNIDALAMPNWWVYHFFPETWAEDGRRFWAAQQVQAALEARGCAVDLRLTPLLTRKPLSDVLSAAERRDTSQLAILPEAAYQAGLARVRRALAADPQGDYADQMVFILCMARKGT